MQRTAQLEAWIASYGSDHCNPVNHTIHVVCIPLIVFSSLGLLNWIPLHLAPQLDLWIISEGNHHCSCRQLPDNTTKAQVRAVTA